MRIPALIGLALVGSLAGCSRPSEVCIADETLTTARSLLLDHLIGDLTGVDVDLVRRAFDDVVTFELIRFEGEDKTTRTISCRAQVKSPNSRGLAEIVYVRQPNVGAQGYVYNITLEPVADAAWALIAIDVVARAQSMGTGSPSPASGRAVAENPRAPAAPSAVPSSPQKQPAFRTLELEGSDGVTLGKFQEWASEREGGDVSWQASDMGIEMRLTWKYDDGRRTVVETTFEPAGPGRVRLGETSHDGEALSIQGARELIDGVVIDMYHRGMTGP